MFISVSSSNQPCSTNKEDRSKSSSARQNLSLLSKQSRQCTQNISKPPLHLHTIQSRWSLIHAAFLTTGWSLQVVTRQSLGESPAPAPCRTALRCCACCTQRSSTRTASWPAASRLFPTLLSASHTFLFQIHKTQYQPCSYVSPTFICSGSETARRRFMNAFIAKTTSSPAVLVSSCNQLPFVRSINRYILCSS